MAFDQITRNRLQRFVTDARCVLEEEFTRQLQSDYGLDPASGTAAPLESLRHINDQQRETARILRDTLAHYCAGSDTYTKAGLDRIVREQAFTILNRLAALRMAEARGLLIESVGNGYQAKGFQLYARLAGTGLGETGDVYRVYLQSVFDEFALDLPGLFDRYSPQGRLFPREAALLQVLALINHGEIEQLWADDETIGWIYQYFNSKEERKAMRDASQTPRNSRELAVRNQFFTPRYVVEFLVDNTLGRLWFNWTGGQTGLRDRCQYLLVKPEEQPEPVKRLRDPRTIKLLDPACGSMHFGLYAFDLFLEIYREAWAWEQTNGPGCLDTETSVSMDLKPLGQTYANQDAFLHDVPRLIIEYNIYGVDIDPRAAQIASLALWLRAQRAWHEAGVKAKDRPQVGQGQVVAAVAPPAEVDLRKRFMEELDPLDAELFEQTLLMLKGLPELGVLLQVEKELPALIRKVFGTIGDLLNTSSRGKSWAEIEARLRKALTDYTRAARSTYRGRLFAEDALQGLRMIDHCREVFDVVVMNPPFGATSSGTKAFITKSYSNSKGDLLAVFVQRSLELLRSGGQLGAITSRAPFFLGTMEDWRKNVVLRDASPQVFADLGMGIMDDAMVEAAAYTIEKTKIEKIHKIDCIRVLTSDDKSHAIIEAKLNPNSKNRFSISMAGLNDSPSHAFAYWMREETLKKLSNLSTIDPSLVSIRVGMQTGSDWRFLRQWWEVDPERYVTLNEDGSPKQGYERDGQRWITYTKTDRASPWYAPLLQVVKWEKQGLEYDAFLNESGKSRAALRSRELYFKPGFSYMLRSARLVPYIVPCGAIPTAGRAQGFGEGDGLLTGLILVSSNIGSAWARLTGEMFERPKFQAGMVQSIPAIDLSQNVLERCRQTILREYVKRRSRFVGREPSREYLFPDFFRQQAANIEWQRKTLLGDELEDQIALQYHLSGDEFVELQRDLLEALEFQEGSCVSASSDVDDEEAVDQDLSDTPQDESMLFEGLISYAVGVCFGRWDMRMALDCVNNDAESDPFKALSPTPPGWLLWDKLSDIERQTYPLSFARSGIIEHDNSTRSDLMRKLAECFDFLKARKEIDEDEICRGIGASSLSEYFARASGFFSLHLEMYSGGGRKAPIYWPLSTSSGSFILWLYYPRMTSQTLYSAVNDFVEPKLKQVSRDAANLRDKAGARTRDDERQLEALQAFELELIELRDTLLKLAPTYKPNHDDGVQISAAPLWPLFRHKPWQKVLKDTWAKLEKGEYDWAHLAMAYWPERVREKCKTDKSLAIAHDLEGLYVEPDAQPKKSRGKKKAGGDQ